MNPQRRQQLAPNLVRKILRGKDEPETIVGLIERHIAWERPQEEVQEDLTRWFLVFRDSFKQGILPPQFTLSKIIGAFRKLALKKDIGPERFYSALLEKIITEPDPEENSRGAAQRTTKNRILDAALEVFSEKGFHVATVDEIAERAGVGKGTLYRYFSNKETLFNDLMRLRLEELERKASAVLDGSDDVLTMIEKYLRTYFEFFDHNQRLYRLIVQERLDVGAHVQDLYLKKVMRRISLLKRKVHGASRQGILKEIDFQTVFYGVMGFVHGVIQKWLACDCSYPLVEELPAVKEVLFYGFVEEDRQ